MKKRIVAALVILVLLAGAAAVFRLGAGPRQRILAFDYRYSVGMTGYADHYTVRYDEELNAYTAHVSKYRMMEDVNETAEGRISAEAFQQLADFAEKSRAKRWNSGWLRDFQRNMAPIAMDGPEYTLTIVYEDGIVTLDEIDRWPSAAKELRDRLIALAENAAVQAG